MAACRYVKENGLAGILATMRSAGVTPEVNLREHVVNKSPPTANKAAHSGFETQKVCHQKSKAGVSVAPQKGHVLQEFCKPRTVAHSLTYRMVTCAHSPQKLHKAFYSWLECLGKGTWIKNVKRNFWIVEEVCNTLDFHNFCASRDSLGHK